MTLDTIRNYVQLTESIGTSGQPTDSQFPLIAAHGYTTVINLAMPDHSDSIANEGEIVSALGMTYVHLPVPFDAPQPLHLRRFSNLMSGLEGERVWVHCIMNYRVSVFMLHYLEKVAGLSPEQSRSPMFDRWQPDETWNRVLAWDAAEIGLDAARRHLVFLGKGTPRLNVDSREVSEEHRK